MPQIDIENLKVEYHNKSSGKVVAINGFDATFLSEKVNVIIGCSGCGKTTLLKAITGVLDYEGEIKFDGESVDTIPTHKRDVGFVSQEYVLYPNMTIFDNIAFPLKLTKMTRDEIVERVLEVAGQFDLVHCLTRKPKHLSGGQQQRIAIVRCLVKQPSICLMDEPLSNIDEQQRYETRIYLKEYFKNNKTTVLYVTHNLLEATALADTITVMDKGKNVICGDPLYVFNSCNPIVLSLKGIM